MYIYVYICIYMYIYVYIVEVKNIGKTGSVKQTGRAAFVSSKRTLLLLTVMTEAEKT